jgi:hypothetical protein
MSRLLIVLLILSSLGFAQSSSDGSFSVHQLNNTRFPLKPAELIEAESIYHSACLVVQREFHKGANEPCPHFTVLVGAARNELQSKRTHEGQIRMKKWDLIVFAQGVVVLTFDQILARDMIVQLASQALRQSNAVDVAGVK